VGGDAGDVAFACEAGDRGEKEAMDDGDRGLKEAAGGENVGEWVSEIELDVGPDSEAR